MTSASPRSAAPWVQTYSGQPFDLLAPDHASVRLVDILYSLSHLNRYTGHTVHGPYSVAQHSVLVAELVRLDGGGRQLQLEALLHDAPEAYYGDVTSPVSSALKSLGGGRAWDALRSGVDCAVRLHFGLAMEVPAEVKRADLRVLSVEQFFRMSPCERDWELPYARDRRIAGVPALAPWQAAQQLKDRLGELGVHP